MCTLFKKKRKKNNFKMFVASFFLLFLFLLNFKCSTPSDLHCMDGLIRYENERPSFSVSFLLNSSLANENEEDLPLLTFTDSILNYDLMKFSINQTQHFNCLFGKFDTSFVSLTKLDQSTNFIALSFDHETNDFTMIHSNDFEQFQVVTLKIPIDHSLINPAIGNFSMESISKIRFYPFSIHKDDIWRLANQYSHSCIVEPSIDTIDRDNAIPVNLVDNLLAFWPLDSTSGLLNIWNDNTNTDDDWSSNDEIWDECSIFTSEGSFNRSNASISRSIECEHQNKPIANLELITNKSINTVMILFFFRPAPNVELDRGILRLEPFNMSMTYLYESNSVSFHWEKAGSASVTLKHKDWNFVYTTLSTKADDFASNGTMANLRLLLGYDGHVPSDVDDLFSCVYIYNIYLTEKQLERVRNSCRDRLYSPRIFQKFKRNSQKFRNTPYPKRLKLENANESDSDLLLFLPLIGGLIGLVCVIGAFIAFYCFFLRKRQKKNNKDVKLEKEEMDGVCENLIYESRNYEITWKNINLLQNSLLGGGAFGKVHKGKLVLSPQNCYVVAVKVLPENATEEQRISLLREIEIMKRIDKLCGHHPNLLSILACISSTSNLALVVPYCEMGSLQSFVRDLRGKASFKTTIPFQTGIFCYIYRLNMWPMMVPVWKLLVFC